MRFEDRTQNLPARLRTIQIFTLALLAICVVRLYNLQVVHGDYYRERAVNQRLRTIPIPAPRGMILDRHGRVLVDSRPIYDVVLQREIARSIDLNELARVLPTVLDVDPDYLQERFGEMKANPAYQSILIKANATMGDIAWVEAHSLEFPYLQIEQRPQRHYPANGLLAHVLGYVGEISFKQLDSAEYKSNGYNAGDVIGKKGLEATYERFLRGREGSRTVIVDSLGRIRDVIEVIEPAPGQDLVTTIDLDLQKAAEEQLQNSPSQCGVIIALDPNNGEILALASYPTFDPNLFTDRIATTKGRAEYAALLRNPETPLYNRAIQGRYPPGSTWKIPMAVAALQQGVITLDDSKLFCGGGIRIGNKFTRCMGHHGKPDLHTAIMKSCDGYFYRLGLKMGLTGIMDMVEEFRLNKATGIDLPHELVSWTPSPEFKARFNPNSPEWTDIDTVYASFGQVYDFVTPIALVRSIAAVGVQGRLYTPHLLREVRAASHPGDDYYREAMKFDPAIAGVVRMTQEQDEAVVKAMWSVVNEAGTAAGIRQAELDIAGKTGTAQVVGLGKDVGKNKDHSWFVSYAPAFAAEIAVLALIENSGFGSRHAAPAARAIYDVYFEKAQPLNEVPKQIAQIPETAD
ncbi:MAG TPA: penicillin-binding protein 2 [Pyrinomonadaceae bacterium]|nr:penicillin-binding protein 2 [Pyrinomonadaceae bacterium]